MCGCYPGFNPELARYLTAPSRALAEAAFRKKEGPLTEAEVAAVMEPFKGRPPFVPFEGALRGVVDLVRATFGRSAARPGKEE